jgi:hypothetical protein
MLFCTSSPLCRASKILRNSLWRFKFLPHPPYHTIMAKSKAKRRLQGLNNSHVAKKSKTSATITPPPDAGEPKTLRSVGLEEDDLEIAIDTLRTLAENPSVIKSKACKDLRTAVYEFRQVCTTGFNASGSYPSSRIAP